MPIGGPGKLKDMTFTDLRNKLAKDPKVKTPNRLAGWIEAKYKKDK
jgi:hypothetical protein